MHKTEALAVVAFALLVGALVVLSTPPVLALTAAAGVVAAVYCFDKGAPLAVGIGAVITILALEGGLRLLPIGNLYYRPLELLAEDDRYKPNQTIDNFAIAHGDLVTLAGKPMPSIAEPRTVSFASDSLGYGNRQELAGQLWILVGDSFIDSASSSQGSTPREEFAKAMGEPVYALAFPGGIPDYVRRYETLAKPRAPNAKAIVFLFEGNDFYCPGQEENVSWHRRLQTPALVRKTYVYRYVFGMRARFSQSLRERGEVVSVRRIGERVVGFYNIYNRATEAPETCDMKDYQVQLGRLQGSLAMIVFIPTKWRTYASLLSPPVTSLGNANLRRAQDWAKNLGVSFLDLTPVLVRESARLLPEGQYTFYRDDTHWNGNGIRVSMQAIAAILRPHIPDATCSWSQSCHQTDNH